MIICADDYGFADDINDAILELCASGKLSAVSCAAALRLCSPAVLKELVKYQGNVDIGLHLCFADETLELADSNGRFPPYNVLVRRALFGQLKPSEIAAQAAAQYAQFVEKSGRRPDFIDGHLHAHQLPGVRQGLIAFVRSLPIESRPYIRNTRLPLRKLWKRRLPWLKAAGIGIFGARMLAELRVAGLRTNEGFAGIYDFGDWHKYSQHLPGFVECLSHPNGILVVHPGHREEWRRQEFASLRAFRFSSGMPNRFGRDI